MTAVVFLPAARDELMRAAQRYESEVAGLGVTFITEVERTVERVSTFPEHGAPYLGRTRRVILRRFPFAVVYQSTPEEITIVAVSHHSRRPAYWRGRMA